MSAARWSRGLKEILMGIFLEPSLAPGKSQEVFGLLGSDLQLPRARAV